LDGAAQRHRPCPDAGRPRSKSLLIAATGSIPTDGIPRPSGFYPPLRRSCPDGTLP
jgi:hypothetical protein